MNKVSDKAYLVAGTVVDKRGTDTNKFAYYITLPGTYMTEIDFFTELSLKCYDRVIADGCDESVRVRIENIVDLSAVRPRG